MIPEISASLTALKNSLDLLSVIRDAKNESVIQKATCELQQQLMTLQIENIQLAQLLSSQIQEVNSLRDTISQNDKLRRNLESWIRYKTDAGFFVYALKEDLSNSTKDIPYACAHCYHQDQVSILQPLPTEESNKFHRCKCPLCKTVYSMQKNESYKPMNSIEELARDLNRDIW